MINEVTQRIREKNIILKSVKWLGKNVTLIYVIQWIIIGNIATEIYKTVSNPVYLIAWILGITIVCYGFGYLITKLKDTLT